MGLNVKSIGPQSQTLFLSINTVPLKRGNPTDHWDIRWLQGFVWVARILPQSAVLFLASWLSQQYKDSTGFLFQPVLGRLCPEAGKDKRYLRLCKKLALTLYKFVGLIIYQIECEGLVLLLFLIYRTPLLLTFFKLGQVWWWLLLKSNRDCLTALTFTFTNWLQSLVFFSIAVWHVLLIMQNLMVFRVISSTSPFFFLFPDPFLCSLKIDIWELAWAAPPCESRHRTQNKIWPLMLFKKHYKACPCLIVRVHLEELQQWWYRRKRIELRQV